jgi:hypothetical protein
MANTTIEELRAENRLLRALIVSISATLLRNVAFNPPNFSNVSSADAHRLVVEAEQCFRCARIPGLKAKIAEGLEVAGEELMARAVEIDTMLQRRNRTNG